MLGALAVLDATRRGDVYWAGRLTLCGDHEDLDRYDRVFDAYFSGERSPVRPARPRAVRTLVRQVGARPPAGDDGDEERKVVWASASTAELLRRRDFATLDADERALLARLLDAFRLPGESRRTRRLRPAARGRLDRARTVRDLLRRGGEPARLRHRRPHRKPRRVVLLVDISGSMSVYASGLLRFAHAASRRRAAGTEVFTVGTRLTRVTREMSHRDPDTAMAAVSAAMPDWSGGTRLGSVLKEFLDGWGQRGTARGAVVVVLSDGWERDDVALLGEQMARLGRLAHRVVWANPRKGRPGYAPLAAGMAAALPHVDDFVEGHSLEALEHLARVVAGASRREAGGSFPAGVVVPRPGHPGHSETGGRGA
ncbi:MAG: VWA domain-containing protein [Actinobacteria bacterium]|nr:VWA domain-containing protein [Actinomycetota bacterium]